MIIDFTQKTVPLPDNTMLRDWARKPEAGAPESWWKGDDNPFVFDASAYAEWKEFRDRRLAGRDYSHVMAVEIIENALHDPYIRDVLKQAVNPRIREKVLDLIGAIERLEKKPYGTDYSIVTKYAVATKIVDLDEEVQRILQ